MSLDDFIRDLLNIPPLGPRGGNHRDRPGGGVDGEGGERSDGRPPNVVDVRPRHGEGIEGFYDFDRFIQRQMQSIFAPFFGGSGGGRGHFDHDSFSSGSSSPAIGDEPGPFSDRPTDEAEGWSGPRIHVWTWQDTRDEFGDDDRGGLRWIVDGEGGGGDDRGGTWGDGDAIVEEDDDCGCHSFPSESEEGNENWHSRVDGLDLFRGFFGGGFDDLFRIVRAPDDPLVEGDQGAPSDFMMRRGHHGSLRDSMLKKPIVGDKPPIDDDAPKPPSIPLPDDFSSTSPPHDRFLPPGASDGRTSQRDETLDFKTDEEKRREIERILSSTNRDPADPDSTTTTPPPPRADASSPHFSWGSVFPRRFWNGWFFGDGDGGGGGGGGEVDKSFSRRPWGGSFHSRSTMTSQTVKPDGSVESKKTVRDGSGSVTETITRRRGSRIGSVTITKDERGVETTSRSGDQSLF